MFAALTVLTLGTEKEFSALAMLAAMRTRKSVRMAKAEGVELVMTPHEGEAARR